MAKEHPKIVEQLTKQHVEWFASVKPGMNPTRIVVGSDVEDPTDLTSQEWVMPKGGPPWARAHVVRRMIANGPWWLDVAKAGNYRITLSRWPPYINRPLESTAASIEIAGQSISVEIDQPNDTTTAEFQVSLPAGPTKLLTSLTTPDGVKHGAYFATVQRVKRTEPTQASLLWTQYCLAGNTLKMSAHTDADPMLPTKSSATLYVKTDKDWRPVAEVAVDPLTAMAEFRVEDWDATVATDYRVTCGESEWRQL